MKKLLKEYGITTISEYRQMVLDSIINGQRTQAREQFLALPKAERKEFVKDVIFDQWHEGTEAKQKECGMFLFNLL